MQIGPKMGLGSKSDFTMTGVEIGLNSFLFLVQGEKCVCVCVDDTLAPTHF